VVLLAVLQQLAKLLLSPALNLLPKKNGTLAIPKLLRAKPNGTQVQLPTLVAKTNGTKATKPQSIANTERLSKKSGQPFLG
jgi:hypothetical protein